MMATMLTIGQKRSFARLLVRIGSWSGARWDQHLRYDSGDEDADAIIAWARAALAPELEEEEGGRPWRP